MNHDNTKGKALRRRLRKYVCVRKRGGEWRPYLTVGVQRFGLWYHAEMRYCARAYADLLVEALARLIEKEREA